MCAHNCFNAIDIYNITIVNNFCLYITDLTTEACKKHSQYN